MPNYKKEYKSLRKLLNEDVYYYDVTNDLNLVLSWVEGRRSSSRKLNDYDHAADKALWFCVPHDGRLYLPVAHWEALCRQAEASPSDLIGVSGEPTRLGVAVARKGRAVLTGAQVRTIKAEQLDGLLAGGVS